MDKPMKLVSKLAKVMQEVKHIEKKGYNKFHKYSYATEADVNERVREELAKVNVIMIPSMIGHNTKEHINRNGNTEYIVTVDMEFTFIDGETGESIKLNMSGSGQDAGDKGIYKAISGAQKYALMKAFMIPTGDDPEQDTNPGETEEQKPITNKQIGEIKAIVKELATARGKTDADYYKVLKITDITKLNEGQAISILKQLRTWQEQLKKGA